MDISRAAEPAASDQIASDFALDIQLNDLMAGRMGLQRRGTDSPNQYPFHDVPALLRRAEIRLTRQRLALGWILFAKGRRHLTAEMLYEEAMCAKIAVSLATIYNTLNQFTAAGLLREVSVDASKAYFDTNVSNHHHFFMENEHHLIDFPAEPDVIGKLPDVPEGYEVSRVDVVVRLRRRER